MRKLIVSVVVGLVVIVAGVYFGLPLILKQTKKPAVSEGKDVKIEGTADPLAETNAMPGDIFGEEGEEQPFGATETEPSAAGEQPVSLGEEAVPLGEEDEMGLGNEGAEEPLFGAETSPGEARSATAKRDITTSPAAAETPRAEKTVAATTAEPGIRPGGKTTSAITSPASEATAAPSEIIPKTATAASASISAPEPGNYNVRTLEPVFESKLPAVRKTMTALGVHLQERKAGQQQLPAVRVAVGFFQTKSEAEFWARSNFRPLGIQYYIYPAQGMYSIQVGVFADQRNVESAMRDLYRKYPGGRLPVRREPMTITKSAYELSLTNISKALADKIWRELTRLGIQAEISGV